LPCKRISSPTFIFTELYTSIHSASTAINRHQSLCRHLAAPEKAAPSDGTPGFGTAGTFHLSSLHPPSLCYLRFAFVANQSPTQGLARDFAQDSVGILENVESRNEMKQSAYSAVSVTYFERERSWSRDSATQPKPASEILSDDGIFMELSVFYGIFIVIAIRIKF